MNDTTRATPSIGSGLKPRLPFRFQRSQDNRLERSVSHDRDAERALPPAGLGHPRPLDRPGSHPAVRRCAQSARSALDLGPSAVMPSIPAVMRPALTSATRRTAIKALARERSISFCKPRTFLRSPARDAVKIRCRRRRTSPSTRCQSIDSHARASPSGPFTPPQPRRPTCPSVPASPHRAPSPAHLTHVGALSGRGTRPRIRPVPSRQPLEERPWCLLFLSPFGAPALACWVILRPLVVRLPHGRPTEAASDPSGLPRCPRARSDRDGCPLYSGGAVPTRPAQAIRPSLAASQRPTPLPRCCFHPPGLGITERRQGFTRVHPSGLPRCL
jgi:hypothetical protein